MNKLFRVPIAGLIASGIAAFLMGWRREPPPYEAPKRNDPPGAMKRDTLASDWAELLASFRL